MCLAKKFLEAMYTKEDKKEEKYIITTTFKYLLSTF